MLIKAALYVQRKEGLDPAAWDRGGVIVPGTNDFLA